MLIDSHCHLQQCFDSQNLTQEILKLMDKLAYLVDISTNISEILNSQKQIMPLHVLSAYGLYPENALAFNPSMADDFNDLLKKKRPSAIGEVGLDFHWDYGSIELQEKLFRNQIEAAVHLDLPLIIHSRDSFVDTLRILSDYRFQIPVILHCFGYGRKEAEEFLRLGYYISFAGNLTYKNAKDLHEAAFITPLDRILLETDAPYLSPVPLRGQKNIPTNVQHTYHYLSQLKKTDENELEHQILLNFQGIFKI